MRRSDLLRSRPARGRAALVALLAAGAAGLALLPAHDASAQLMIKIREPNVLLVLDNSASMAFTPDGSAADCSNGDESKWFIVAEALTGTVAEPWCKSSGTLTADEDFSSADNSWIAFGDDNGGGPGNKQVCVAAPRRSDFAWSRSENPGRWYMTGGGSQPIV
jgi:hypothetical protein